MEKTEQEVDQENRIEEMIRIRRIQEIQNLRKQICKLFFEVRRERKISYRTIAKELGCSSTYLAANLESKKEKPSIEILLGMVEFIFS